MHIIYILNRRFRFQHKIITISAKTRRATMTEHLDLSTLVEAKDSSVHGKGLFAKVDIKKNTIIGKLEGINIDKDGPHVLWMNEGKDKFQVTNELRFINHHKKPNVAYYDDFTVVALKNIKANTELLHDYGDDWE